VQVGLKAELCVYAVGTAFAADILEQFSNILSLGAAIEPTMIARRITALPFCRAVVAQAPI
jgi:hypothetical protein